MLQQKNKPAPKGPMVDPTHPKDTKKVLNPPAQIGRVRFSPDGKLLFAACFDATIRRWDVTGDEPKELPPLTGHNGWVTGIAVTPRQLFSTDSWGRLTAWDLDGKQLWTKETAHDGWARGVAVSGDQSVVATCGKDGIVRQWEAATGKPGREWKVGTDLLAVAYIGADALLVGDLFGVVRQFAYAAGKPEPVRTFEVKELHRRDRIQDVGGVRNIVLDPTGKTLVVAGAVPQTGAFVQCTPHVVGFDWASGKRTFTLKGESEKEGYVTDVKWHPTGGYLMLTTSGQPGNGKLLFWRPNEEKPYFVNPRANAHSLDLHPDGRRLAVSATNANSSGNGRPKNKNGTDEYPANFSPIYFFEMPGIKA